ncbi:hypothetical protein Tco_1028361 [Tanacetum coccineum]|uniref:Uncharacterized protein n=1 Tax=Tanacetum coccineum TaxID=301880 RepID=A0ABQ5G1S0_9ASTR
MQLPLKFGFIFQQRRSIVEYVQLNFGVISRHIHSRTSSEHAEHKWSFSYFNLGLGFEALDKRQMGEDRSMSSNESVYKLVSLETVSRSTPSKLRTKSIHIINPGDYDIPNLIVTIPHNLCNLIITKSDGTKKFFYKVDELRAMFGHMLGASRVQVPEDDLDDLQWTREEDGEFKIVDP